MAIASKIRYQTARRCDDACVMRSFEHMTLVERHQNVHALEVLLPEF